ncbi:hypothetical protein [Azospirillum sp. ST 5-10]|uniref:hypothetical protein n=1 Tax=unclassified Azospirillum TaxID=2630922 RepID=UPI003F4A0BEC
MRGERRPVRPGLVAAMVLLAGCSGGERLATAVAEINRDYGSLQDEILLVNILRRSVSLPAHFTALTTIRGRSRITAGADLTVPFGGDAPAQFDFRPHLSIDQGPSFEISTQDNQEFYRGYIAPIDTRTVDYYLRQDAPKELILSLFIDRIRIRRRDGDDVFVNTPDQPANYAGFQRQISRLVDQGLMTETVSLARHVGPELHENRPPTIDQLLSVRKEGLTVERVGANRYRLMDVNESAQFCFRNPAESLFERARCHAESARAPRYTTDDPSYFGSTGGPVARFATDDLGAIEIHTRSLAEILDFLGELARVQRSSGAPPTIRTVSGPQPILVITAAGTPGAAAVSADFAGTRYAIPAGAAGGQSGTVLSIVSQLLAQAQSVKDLPVSNTVTIIGE